MAETNDKARIRLARLRCLLSCLQAIHKGESCNHSICTVPRNQKILYTSSQTLPIYAEASKDSKKLGEVGGFGKEEPVCFQGLPLHRQEGVWVHVTNPFEGYCVIEDKGSKDGSSFKLEKPSDKSISPWMEAIDDSFGINLASGDKKEVEPDHEWTQRLSKPPEGWTEGVDRETVRFLVEKGRNVSEGGVAKRGEHFSKVEVSSNHSDVGNLTDGKEDSYWESNGEVGQHWIRLHINPGLVMEAIVLIVDREDDSFIPRNVSVKTIDASGHKVEVAKKTFSEADYMNGELKLLPAPFVIYVPKIEVNIKSCNSGGFDTRLHGMVTTAKGSAQLFHSQDLVSGLESQDSLAHYPALQGLALEAVHSRCVLLKRLAFLLDQNLLYLLPQWQFSHSSDYLSLVKQLLPLCPTRQRFISEALIASGSSKSSFTPVLHINRFLAAEHKDNPSKDKEGKNTVFCQIYKSLLPRMSKGKFNLLSAGRSTQWWEVKFAKEHIIDQGGGFRDSLTDLAEELCPPSSDAEVPLPFFIRSPNQAQDSSNIYRDAFAPNPGCHDYTKYRFIGTLMGGAYRSNELLVLALPKLFWKQVVGDVVEWSEDFPSVDSGEVKFINSLESMTKEEFNVAFADTLTFTTVLSGGEVVPLLPGGEKRGVKFEERAEFCRLVKGRRISESSKQTAAILDGLLSVVPREVLALHTWEEVEIKVCGNPEITVEALKKHTIYNSDAGKDDARVQTMWKALERFTNEERGQFLRFITGRRRLPCSVFLQSMRETNCLPRAATCSNCLYLPDYTSVDIAYKKLLFAAYNCIAIDTDG